MDHTWVEEISAQAEMYLQRTRPDMPSIFRVPPIMRSGNPDAYEPKLVSIGPYHRGKPSLQDMEEIKWQLLRQLLSIVPKDRIRLCLKKMQELEEDARSYYTEAIDMESRKFAEMLLLDGYFIIQLFVPSNLMAKELKDHLRNNTLFTNYVFEDLILAENQIPYFIFEHLLGILNIPELQNFRLRPAILRSFYNTLSLYLNFQNLELDQGFKVAHLLHLLHEGILSIPWKNESNASRDSLPSGQISYIMPSATELMEAGVEIKKKDARNLLDISFHKGVLEIPSIGVDDSTNLIFRNLIILEQYYMAVGMQISNYTYFMDSIINTESDVALLSHKRIIDRGLGSDMDVANVFNGLCKNIKFDPYENYLSGVIKDVNAYRNQRWPRWRQRLKHDYFSNPWAIISVIAAIFLLVLSILQTIFSVLSYAQQSHSTNWLRTPGL